MAEINYTVSSSPGLDWLILRIELPAGSQLYIQPGLSPRHATALMMMHEPERASSSKKKKKYTQMHAANACRWEQGNKRVKWILAARENRLWKLISEFPPACSALPTTQSPFSHLSFFIPLLYGFQTPPTHLETALLKDWRGWEQVCVESRRDAY